MKTIKVAEATNIQLDWLVCRAGGGGKLPIWQWVDGRSLRGMFCYTTDWAQGGPIIEREMSKLVRNVGGTFTAQIRHEVDHPLVAHKVPAGWTNAAGPAPLVAAMRCLVKSKFGPTAEIPEELT